MRSFVLGRLLALVALAIVSGRVLAEPVEFTIENRSSKPIEVKAIGPTLEYFAVPTGGSATITLRPGRYYLKVRRGTAGGFDYLKLPEFEVRSSTSAGHTIAIGSEQTAGKSGSQRLTRVEYEAPAPALPLTSLQKAEQGLSAALMDRVVRIMDAEAIGKDVRNRLEKALDELRVTELRSATYRAQLVQLAVALMKRSADIGEARSKGKDIRNKLERARDQAPLRAHTSTPRLTAARARFHAAIKARETRIEKAKQQGKDIRTEIEKALTECDAAVLGLAEYKAARKRLESLGQRIPPGNSVPHRVAFHRLTVMRQQASRFR